MKLLWLFCLLPVAVYGHVEFGTSYLKNSRLCHQWSCINTHLGFPDSLPLRQVAEEALQRNVPLGAWQDVLRKALDTCYNYRVRNGRVRRYTNTCPGQALLHCVVDQMIDECPEEHLRKDDACSPLSSLAGVKDMFAMSRYNNLEKNLPKEHRPEWFLKDYFDQNCCDLPTIFNSSVLQNCGFSSFITYYERGQRHQDVTSIPLPTRPAQVNEDVVQIVSLNSEQNPNVLSSTILPPLPPIRRRGEDVVQIVSLNSTQTPNDLEYVTTDPLDCCDVSEFIQPSWRSECSFSLTWKGHERLVIANYTPDLTTSAPVTTSTARTTIYKDLMLLPQSCAQENCIFKKLGVIDDAGRVIAGNFWVMLENFTAAHPTWKKSASRVLSKCLDNMGRDYEGSCEINKVLACTFDVLTEHCPFKRESEDTCKHNKRTRGCQISTSKLRPKYRRKVCLLPPLVPLHLLSECGLDSLYRAEYVAWPELKLKKHLWKSYNLCQDQLPSTTCLMNKMEILNKYKFMDYFRMKDRIRQFTSNQTVWSALQDFYMSAFINIPMYGQHCSSQKKLLNVIDAMLTTCPISKRNESPQCKKFFKDMILSSPTDNQRITKQKLDRITKHYNHIFLPSYPSRPTFYPVIRKPIPKTVKKSKSKYDLLNAQKTPAAKVINIEPVVVTRLDKPLVLAPVYMRDSTLDALSRRDSLYRNKNNPYWLHERIAKAHITTPASNIARLG